VVECVTVSQRVWVLLVQVRCCVMFEVAAVAMQILYDVCVMLLVLVYCCLCL